jgi:hypothetical protein
MNQQPYFVIVPVSGHDLSVETCPEAFLSYEEVKDLYRRLSLRPSRIDSNPVRGKDSPLNRKGRVNGILMLSPASFRILNRENKWINVHSAHTGAARIILIMRSSLESSFFQLKNETSVCH